MTSLSSLLTKYTGANYPGIRRLLKLQFEYEAFRFILYFVVLAATSACAKFFSIPGVPFLYIDLFLLAPFFRHGWANVLMVMSIIISIIRVIQGFYGFDQLFISAYLLLCNINGFPVWVAMVSLLVVIAVLLVFFTAIRFLPRFIVGVTLPVYFLIMMTCFGIKLQEDNSKSNLIGTSFGYLFGQLHFSEMFYGRYEIPKISDQPYPGQRGAAYATKNGTNLVLFVIESMGVPRVNMERDKLFFSFGSSQILEKYEVVQGVIPASGSTIHGEIRELCGGRLAHGLFGGSAEGCIPMLMAREGYETTAIHANYSKMYGRNEWYPKIGFKNYINSNTGELPKELVDDRWGTTLDTSLIKWLGSRDAQQGKTFEYVLTVSSHLPAVLLPGANIWESCSQSMTTHACTHLANLKLVLDEIISYARRRENTTFIIVGDHPPPFVSPASRAGFKDFEVPYFILQPKVIFH